MGDDSGGSVEYGLVMPFVVCRTNGGPYDDQSFVAGYQVAAIDSALVVAAAIGASVIPVAQCVYRPLLPQLDLVGMRHGYRMRSHDVTAGDDAETWSTVEFYRDAAADLPGSRVADHEPGPT